MKYYKILDPGNLDPDEEEDSVFLGWKEIVDPCIKKGIEDDIYFLYYLLINLPIVESSGDLVEKTLLIAQPIPEIDFYYSENKVSISDDLSICYEV